MDLLSMHGFVTSRIGHLENAGVLSYVDLPNVDIFHCTISKTPPKITLLTITADHIPKLLCIGKPSRSLWQIKVFQNSKLHLKH